MNSLEIKAIIFFIFSLLVGSPLILQAQKCNYEKNEIDALTEFAVKRTAPEMLLRISGQPLYVKAQCIGPNKYLKIVFLKYNEFSFKEDREIGLILSNNQELVLYPRLSSVDSTKMDDGANATSLLIYKLSGDQYQTLTQTSVTKFKYFVSEGFIEGTIKSSKQNKIMEVLKCVE